MFAEHTQFNLGHIEPTAMFGRVVELQALCDSCGLRGVESLVQRSQLVGVEIVQHHTDQVGLRICMVHQPRHLMCEVLGRLTSGHFYMTLPSQGLGEHEQVASSASHILIVVTLHSSRLWWDARILVCYQLLGGLIEADNRASGIIIT